MTRYYVALGSNLGDRMDYLRKGIRGMRALGLNVAAVSSVYETAPWGNTDQAAFLNAVAAVDTPLSPRGVLHRLQAIEERCGRTREVHWGPRTLDLDLVYADGVCWQDRVLTLPHPYVWERGFVLAPLAEIAPQIVYRGETVAARAASRTDGVERIGPLIGNAADE